MYKKHPNIKVGIKYSLRNLICGVTNYCAGTCYIMEMGLCDKIVIENSKKKWF